MAPPVQIMGMAKSSILLLAVGRRWPWSPRMITRVLSHKPAFADRVDRLWGSHRCSGGHCKKAELVIALYLLGLGVSKGSWLVRVSTTWKKGFCAGLSCRVFMLFWKINSSWGPTWSCAALWESCPSFDLAKAHGAEIGTHARKLEVATVFCLVVDVIFNINLGWCFFG